jgi:hypothetical protein
MIDFFMPRVFSQDYSISVDEIRKIVVQEADAAGVTHV